MSKRTQNEEMGVFMMRLGKCLAIALVLLIPAMALAATGPATKDALTFGKATLATSAGTGHSRTIRVPLVMSNIMELAAVDMPLRYGVPGDGIELKAVEFDSRLDDFDVKIANIDNTEKTVIIGLVPLAFDPTKRRMEAGEGPIGEMVFEVSDPTIEEFTIETFTTERPHHRLMWVYSHVDNDGNRTVDWTAPEFKPITIQVSAAGSAPIPTSYSLRQNYPNPFNAGTNIAFDLPNAGDVKLHIYNVLGQEVRSFDETFEAGSHTITWDGRQANGDVAASGIYFYRIQATDFVATKKMTLLK